MTTTMLKKLSFRFSFIACTILFLVELLMAVFINGLSFLNAVDGADETIALIMDNEGSIPEKNETPDISEPEKPAADVTRDSSYNERKKRAESERQYITRYFSAAFNADGELTWLNASHIASLSEEETIAYAYAIFDGEDESGFIDGMYYRYAAKEFTILGETETLIVVYDFSGYADQIKSVIFISAVIGVILFIICSAIITLLSKSAVKPIIDNMEKQSRFVTDAGHELKTPLAIIRADAEVIEMTEGESEWTRSILSQTDRLSKLLEQMLILARARENQKHSFTRVDLSEIAFAAERTFSTYCAAANKPLNALIEDGVSVSGDAKMLEMLFSVLLQNAVKYGSEGKPIDFSFSQNGRYAVGSVSNLCDEPPRCDPKLLFERFFREDSSRTRETGGSGVGLSIARSITELHKGKISCSIDGKRITFKFKLPQGAIDTKEN